MEEYIVKGGKKLRLGYTTGSCAAAAAKGFCVMLGSSHDAEDVVQDTLIRYMEHGKPFRDKNHEKAWLVRVTVNLCKNRLLFARRHPQVEYSELAEYGQDQKDSCLMECLMKLP